MEKTKQSCLTANSEVSDHFLDVRKMVDIGSGTNSLSRQKIRSKKGNQ